MIQLTKEITIANIKLGGNNPLFLIAGPCVLENEEILFQTADGLQRICNTLGFPLLFKSSYDKANRTSVSSFRGPGIEKGLKMLSEVRSRFGIPIISDVHSVEEVQAAAKVLDVIQIPAFLCRQTDLILAAANTGKPVNIKKGQFLAPWDIRNIIEKFIATGNHNVFITERGTSFGYNNLIVDFRVFPVIRSSGYPVIFDVTHSLQLPGGMGTSSGGQREFAEPLARAAVAVGVDGLFLEVHPDPDKALCDGPNMIRLDDLEEMLSHIKIIHDAVRSFA
ncbi:MAG: 3-deoxy-8-phosphooctulonate synthase [Thermodesulfovibrionales bacterium]|nr:3-deoxy-8-phosphooctulonate synthase [Thermodesulfovibrionales bacterium]